MAARELRNCAIDQHLTARNRQEDMLQVIARHPRLLGIGIDESTALVVRGDRAEIVGSGRVAFYNTRDASGQRYYYLQAGDVFDLAQRRTVRGRYISPDDVRDEVAVLRTMN